MFLLNDIVEVFVLSDFNGLGLTFVQRFKSGYITAALINVNFIRPTT